MNLFLVAVGGFLGSISRFYISEKTQKRLIGTWLANITGSVILAFVYYLHIDGNLSEKIWFFLGIGFCGAFTTFSTFGNDTLSLIIDNKYKEAIQYISTTLLISLALVFLVWANFN
ncbi:fluoride efflux transporter CrcB [Oceanobacillus halophilus]|uniref:Fluoride-specific ion channel FluC n=1 Tax=Oceanobacillus halophilus TaxID=930130 RepID=A0A495A6K9_9BACI|nr:fluoride efflux transporter CrcB [Oceanobacillus halophilus]RKQ35497.1 fluoride efflux transporter CrcB [Oceanobacillus halophilus]